MAEPRMRVGDRVKCITTRPRGCCGKCGRDKPAVIHHRPVNETGYIIDIFHGIVKVEWDLPGEDQIENLRMDELEVIPDED